MSAYIQRDTPFRPTPVTESFTELLGNKRKDLVFIKEDTRVPGALLTAGDVYVSSLYDRAFGSGTVLLRSKEGFEARVPKTMCGTYKSLLKQVDSGYYMLLYQTDLRVMVLSDPSKHAHSIYPFRFAYKGSAVLFKKEYNTINYILLKHEL